MNGEAKPELMNVEKEEEELEEKVGGDIPDLSRVISGANSRDFGPW